MSHKFPSGSIVRITSRENGHGFPIGTLVRVEQEGTHYRATSTDGAKHNGLATRWVRDSEIEAVERVEPEPEPEFVRPTVDFSGTHRDHSKARAYAVAAIASKMEPEHKAILRAASEGKVVDALKLRAALDQAFSHNTTRYGAGRDRREGAKRIRHLAHIVNGVIENQIESARVDYVAGAAGEQRRCADLQSLYVKMMRERDQARAEVRHMDEERTADVEAYRALQASANEQRNRLESQVDAAERERDVLAQVLEYALSRMEPNERDRTHGYWDALNEQS